MSGWLWLLFGGVMEIAWVILLRHTVQFSRPLPSLLCVLTMAGSVLGLMLAQRTLPVAISYVVWVGIGVTGVAVYGWLLEQQSLSLPQLFCLLCIIGGMAGLKWLTP